MVGSVFDDGVGGLNQVIYADTYLLTNNGFKPFYKLQVGFDEIASVSLESQSFTFTPLEALLEWWYSGKAVEVRGRCLDLIADDKTPIVYRYKGSKGWSNWSVKDLADLNDGQTIQIPKTFPYAGPYLEVSPAWAGVDPEHYLKFVGYWCGDGGRNQTSANVGTVYAAKERKLEFLKSLTSLDLDFKPIHKPGKKTLYEVRARLPEIGQWLLTHCVINQEKVLPGWFVRLSPNQMGHVFEGLKNSDGYINGDSWAYCSTSLPLVYSVFGMAIANGLNVSVTQREKAGRKTLYHVNFLTTPPLFKLDRTQKKQTKYSINVAIVDKLEAVSIEFPGMATIVSRNFKPCVVGVD